VAGDFWAVGQGLDPAGVKLDGERPVAGVMLDARDQ